MPQDCEMGSQARFVHAAGGSHVGRRKNTVGCPFLESFPEETHHQPLFLAPWPISEGTWMDRSVATEEAGAWLMSMLSRKLQSCERITVRILKGAPLSWCGKLLAYIQERGFSYDAVQVANVALIRTRETY